MVEGGREGQRLALPITPRLASQAGRGDFWMLGIEPVRRSELPPKDAVAHYGPLAAVPAALREMRYQTVQLFDMVGRVFSGRVSRSEEHTSELQSLMRISYAAFCI